MRRSIAILLIVSLGFQFFSKIGIVGYYLINKDYISKVLCINRDKPEMRCDGKCHLKSQLQKQEEQDKKLPAGLKESSETLLFIGSVEMVHSPLAFQSSTLNYIPYTFSVIAERVHSIFHPPQSV